MAVRAAVGLGSNLGDRQRHIAEAIGALSELGSLVSVSALYESAPVGGPDQGPYLNAVAVLETELSARQLLGGCLDIEAAHGRERRERWGPRTLDLDVLLYGDSTIDDDGLSVPHPRLHERRFVLAPLLEAWPDATMPDGTVLADLLEGVADQQVRRLQGPVPQRSLSIAAIAVVVAGSLALWWLADLILS